LAQGDEPPFFGHSIRRLIAGWCFEVGGCLAGPMMRVTARRLEEAYVYSSTVAPNLSGD
jgi:hypothetical protein